MKKFLVIILLITVVFGLTGCTNQDALKFKTEYELLNGKKNAYKVEYRSIKIDSNNPFVYSTTEEIINKIKNKETFYVYFGSPYCPWCRSVLEKAIEVSSNKKIDKIYYINIWDDKYTELIRDKYTINDNNELELVSEGTKDYKKLLEYFDEVLSDYIITNKDNEKISVGEKRIYAPNFIYVEDGKAVKLTSGISSNQKESNGELTKEILEDEEDEFKEFFQKNSNTCDKDSAC